MKKLLITLLVLVLAAALLFGLYYFLWTPENFAALGARAMKAGNYSRAVSRYSTAVELDPDNAEYVIALADACVADGSYTMAERTLVSALRIAPSTELYLKLSATYVAQDKLLDAQQMLDNINNAAIRAEIDAMRPAAPALTPEGGEFSEYITVTVAHADGPAYVSLDKQYPSLASGPCTEPVALPAGATHLSAVVVGENGLVSPLTEADYLIVGVIEEVAFQDSALEACVREQLSLPEGTRIMTSDLWTVTELTVPEEVSDYSDLRHFIHLKSLTIHGSSVEDYSFLSSLTELETLDLSGSLVSAETLGYIGALPKLNALTLSGCGLSNILPLADAETITVLDLSDNSISDIGAFRFHGSDPCQSQPQRHCLSGTASRPVRASGAQRRGKQAHLPRSAFRLQAVENPRYFQQRRDQHRPACPHAGACRALRRRKRPDGRLRSGRLYLSGAA